MALIGYTDQAHEQEDRPVLEAAGCTQVCVGTGPLDTDWQSCAPVLTPGDAVVVTRAVRLGTTAGSVPYLMAELDYVGATLLDLGSGLDTSTEEGRFVVTMTMEVMDAEKAKRQREDRERGQ